MATVSSCLFDRFIHIKLTCKDVEGQTQRGEKKKSVMLIREPLSHTQTVCGDLAASC